MPECQQGHVSGVTPARALLVEEPFPVAGTQLAPAPASPSGVAALRAGAPSHPGSAPPGLARYRPRGSTSDAEELAMRLTLTALGYHLIDLRFCEAVEEDPVEGPSTAVEAASLSLADEPPVGFVQRSTPGSEPFYPPSRYE